MPTQKHLHKKEHEPHDAVFKAFFSDAKIARNYLLHYTSAAIHRHIDFATFQKIDTAFVSGRFGISFSDVLYETRLATGAPARLLFLFEHKSYLPSLPVYLQLLDYLMQIWEDDLKNGRPLSFIIPIVVYHGKRGWKQRPFPDYFPGLPEGWQVIIPNFHYLLTDLSRMPLQEIEDKKESEYLRNLFLALKFARDEGFIFKNWPKILTFGEPFYRDNREGILLQTLTLYIFNLFDMTEAQVKKLNKQLPEPERNWLDAIPEIFGRKWKEEGREEGREETTHAFTIRMLQKFPDWSNAEIAELVGVTDKFVQRVRRELAKRLRKNS